MGTNVNLVDVLKKIASDAGFISSAGSKFGAGETLELLFISGGSDKADTLVLKDTSGDNYSISAQSLQGYLSDDEFNALMAGGENKVTEVPQDISATEITLGTTSGVEANTQVEETASVGSSEQIEKEIEALERQKAANNEVMTSLKEQIEVLREKVEQSIKEALEAMEEATDEQQKQADRIVQKQLEDFQARKADGENVTPEDLAASVKSAISAEGMPEGFSTAVSQLLFADTNVALMNSLLDQLSTKVQIGKDLDKQLDTQNEALEAAKQAEEAAKSCDPIGFQMGGIDTDGDGKAGNAQFDFFYDHDDDGKINSLDDFVGAKADKAGEDGWNEIENLDGAGGAKDGQITADELTNAGIKVMVTDENGKQSAMNISEFEEKFGKIEINSQDTEAGENGFVDNVGPKNFDSDAGNKLLSSFSLKVGGQDLNGYQTSDTQDWLVENFASVMDIDSLKEEGVDVSSIENLQSGEQTDFDKFIEEYRNTVIPQLVQEIKDAYAQLGFSEDLVNSIKELAQATAEVESSRIENEIEAKQEEAAQEGKDSDEAAAQIKEDGTDVVNEGEIETVSDSAIPEETVAVADRAVDTVSAAADAANAAGIVDDILLPEEDTI